MNIVPFSKELAQQLFDSDEQFPIDFDTAWQWLEYSRKDNAKANFLRCGFVEGVDFELLRIQELRPQGGYSNREQIKMTCECLKQWGMMSGTQKGKQIRLYFLECERIAKSTKQGLSQSELILMLAQQNVEIERRLKEQEAETKEQRVKIEALQDKADAQDKWLTGIDAEIDRLNSSEGHYYTVVGYANLHKIKIGKKLAEALGRKASAYCRKNGLRKEMVNDSHFGEIGSYPPEALEFVFTTDGLM